MLGGLGAYIASEINGSVRRNLTIYGLYGLAALLFFCAAAYGVQAVHTWLTFRYGAIAASLWVAGVLAILAIAAIIGATVVKNRKRPQRSMAKTALIAAPVAARLMGGRVSWRMGLVGGIVVLGAVLGRQFFKSDDGADDDEG